MSNPNHTSQHYVTLLRKVAKRWLLSGRFSYDADNRSQWDSILINRRKPETCRLMRNYGSQYRVCIHRFSPCDKAEAFAHPHPWPGAFMILGGSYNLSIGTSPDLHLGPTHMSGPILMRPGCIYAMTDPREWHAVVPLETTYTIMINGPRFEDGRRHASAPTTQGKALEPLSEICKMDMLMNAATMIRSVSRNH